MSGDRGVSALGGPSCVLRASANSANPKYYRRPHLFHPPIPVELDAASTACWAPGKKEKHKNYLSHSSTESFRPGSKVNSLWRT